MNRRLHGMSLGLALLALVALGTIAGRGVFAQDATSTPSPTLQEATPSAESSTDTNIPERNEFLDAFAAQLGVTDQAQIDAAIQAAFSQVLDGKVAAGELTQAEADAIKARVEAGDFRVGFVGPRGHGGFHDGRDSRGHHDRGDDRAGSDENKGETKTTEPAATPSAGLTPAV